MTLAVTAAKSIAPIEADRYLSHSETPVLAENEGRVLYVTKKEN